MSGAATRYPGPLPVAQARTTLKLSEAEGATWRVDGPRDNVRWRDLGTAESTGGLVGMRHSRMVKPFEVETGWHWHDMDAHIVYVLKGWIKFRYDGVKEPVVVKAGACLSQPAGVVHNVVGYSDDLELIEINLPAVHASVPAVPTAS